MLARLMFAVGSSTAAACGGGSPITPTAPSAPLSPSVPTPPPPPPTATERSTSDRPDDVIGAQVKVLYVVPSDGVDRMLDQNQTLVTTVESWSRWVERASGGFRVRLDTFNGMLDVSFVRLTGSDAAISARGISAVQDIQAGIVTAGFSQTNKIYAVYYGGNNTEHCGQSFRSGGQAIAGAFLEARPTTLVPCPQQIVPSNPSPGLTRVPSLPGFWEYVMAHEVFHMLGAVPSCAPNTSSGGHVNDSPTDLMGVFTRPGVAPGDPAVRWNPSAIDVNRDDYFRHGRSCLDVAQSPFLDRS